MSSKPTANAELPRVLSDVACIACGCTCDDIELSVAANRITAARHACPIGERWFLTDRSHSGPACLVDGQPAEIAAGIERAAQILAAARYPLVYGLRGATCEAQALATSLADWCGACLDTPTSTHHGPWGVSFQGVGEVTSSLGEVANRGDLILFWGVDPATTHPRHFERYSVEPHGMFVPRGRADRTVVVVDVRPTATSALADVFVQVKPGSDFEALWTLRALAADRPVDEQAVAHSTGVPIAVWRDLVHRMRLAKFGAVFFGSGLASTRGRHLNTEALLALVRDLNAHTRFVAKSMRGAGNVTGADNVLAWRTGFAFGINLSRGYPRFNPGEYTAGNVLARGEADAALLVQCHALDEFESLARARLQSVPRIVIDSQPGELATGAAVVFRTATSGIHTGGTVYRMDEIPLPLRPALDTPLPSDVDILRRLDERVRQLISTES